ncbi:MAG: Dam family site-specific DNA-(adenine-N6)-methyltransferase [Nitrososphaeraceae archaeon]|nr:Dam family site-specific DNA-(adenine-N6)-methyltransferase [Nitrososphaeraceae archaeon]
MKTFFKYMGGKSKECKFMDTLLPNSITRIVELFGGAAALAHYKELPAHINDLAVNPISLLEAVKDKGSFINLMSQIKYYKSLSIEERKSYYYSCRDKLNLKINSPAEYLFIRQQCFSGMERYNQKGEYNVPFGWYKSFGCVLSHNHHELYQNWSFSNTDYRNVSLNKEDFIFLDPPYYDRLSYGDDTSIKFHQEIASYLSNLSNKWLIVHNDCDLYRDLYKSYNIYTKDKQYSMNFKNRDNSNSKVKHVYITNY